MPRKIFIRKKALKSKALAQKTAKFADDTQAQDIVILDMRNLVNFCDYFVNANFAYLAHIPLNTPQR